jgi:ceramide glucosyltransferase
VKRGGHCFVAEASDCYKRFTRLPNSCHVGSSSFVVMNALEGFLLGLTAASALLYLSMAGGFFRAMRQRQPSQAPQTQPRVSILKPLAGLDDELEENLASFAALDYPDYEILLGVASIDDPAYPIASRFVGSLGRDRARLIVTDENAAINPKVAQLLALEKAASGEIVVVSDSNVRVPPDYLNPLVTELSVKDVAVVSNIVVGTGEKTLGAALENLQFCAFITPGIVAVAFTLGQTITLGKSMAMRREPLRRVGGFARVAYVLSDDEVLGRAFALAGFKVRLSLHTVENRNVACSLDRTIERHTRWAKIRRALVPLSFALEPVHSPVVIATLAFALSPTLLFGCALLFAMAAQTVCATLMMRKLRGSALRWYLVPLEVARSYLLFYCWLRACASRRVAWRGHELALVRDSAIIPAGPSFRWRIFGALRT